MPAEPRVGALVVLRPAGGGDVTTRAITAQNVNESAPDRETAEGARRMFAQAGFQVGPLVGIAFSIEGPRELMTSFFDDFVEREGTGAELSLERLPRDAAAVIQAVVSEAPPDFGPGNP